MSPLLARMAQHPELDISVAYCTLRGAVPTHDPGFNRTVKWDIPLLSTFGGIANRVRHRFLWGLRNPGLYKLIRAGKFDAVLCYLSYLCASFWISYFACRRSGTDHLRHRCFWADAAERRIVEGSPKGCLLAQTVFLADQVIVPSTATRNLMLSLDVPAEYITLTPYSVDNDWWIAQSAKVDQKAVRADSGCRRRSLGRIVAAKLQPWKRPLDLLRAFAQAESVDALLVYAGDGAQRQELEREAAALGVTRRVRFLGFLNQSQFPPVYTSADLMVLPSEYEPFGVVVNEASCCGCPVAASDHVGAARDLIAPVDLGLSLSLRGCSVTLDSFGRTLPQSRTPS